MLTSRQRRPLGRQAIKLASVLLGPKWSHAHTWLPKLELERDESGSYKSIVYSDRSVAPLHSSDVLGASAGSRIYIVGSGPSVLQNDLGLLEPRSCLVLNGAIVEIGARVKEPLAVVIEDERFVWRHITMLKESISPGTICAFSVEVIRALCEQDPTWLSSMQIVLLDDIRKPYQAPRRSIDDLRRNPAVVLNGTGTAGLSRRPDRGVFQGGSVAISAFQLAIYSLPELIGLVGIDILNADQPRFYEQEGNSAPSGLKRAHRRILDHLQLMIEESERQGIQVQNYSKQSILSNCGLAYNPRLSKEL